MPSSAKNGQASAENKSKPLNAADVLALRTFVNKTLAEPPALSESSSPRPSLAQLIEEDPARYRNAIDLLASGNSIQSVAQATGLDLQVIKTISWFVPDFKTTCRFATSRNLAMASLRMSEILAQNSDSISPDKLAFTLAVATEKSELLSGGVTARTETRQVVTQKELEELFNALPRAKVADVKLIESTPKDPLKPRPSVPKNPPPDSLAQ
ncbi:MAG: hypothetical protein WB586_19250 [Chthoniobacterales bacterium]